MEYVSLNMLTMKRCGNIGSTCVLGFNWMNVGGVTNFSWRHAIVLNYVADVHVPPGIYLMNSHW